MPSTITIPIVAAAATGPIGARTRERWHPSADDIINVRVHTGYRECNYRCAYCIAGHGKITEDEYGDPTIDDPTWDESRLRRVIANLLAQPYRMNVRLQVPGEIFLNKKLVKIAEEMSHAPNIVSVNLLTNLSLRAHQYERILSRFDRSRTAIVASFHPTEVRDTREWLESARWAHSHFDFAVIHVAYPALLARLHADHDMLRAEGFTVFVQPYIGEQAGRDYPRDYTAEERDAIRAVMYSRHDAHFMLDLAKPGLCNAGSRYFYVLEDGRVFPCGRNERDEIGNLARSSEVALAKAPMPCPYSTCQCDTDNLNAVVFGEHYLRDGINQHRYRYRFDELALADPTWSEWYVPYRDGALAPA